MIELLGELRTPLAEDFSARRALRERRSALDYSQNKTYAGLVAPMAPLIHFNSGGPVMEDDSEQ
jgi:hypothetical protein